MTSWSNWPTSWKNGVRFPAETGIYFHHRVQTDWGWHILLSNWSRGLFPARKPSRCEYNH